MIEVFTTIKLSNGVEATVYEGNGAHFFAAMSASKGDSGLMLQKLCLALTQINGKPLKEKELLELPIKDVSYLSEVIGIMMSNSFKNGV